MSPARFEPTVLVGERPQTYTLDLRRTKYKVFILCDTCFSAARVGSRM